MWLVCGQATFMIMRDLQCILCDIESDQVRLRVAPFAPFATISPRVRSYFEQCILQYKSIVADHVQSLSLIEYSIRGIKKVGSKNCSLTGEDILFQLTILWRFRHGIIFLLGRKKTDPRFFSSEPFIKNTQSASIICEEIPQILGYSFRLFLWLSRGKSLKFQSTILWNFDQKYYKNFLNGKILYA